MLVIEKKRLIFKTKEIWFSDYPYDVTDCHRVIFYDCKNRRDLEGFACQEFPTLVIDLTQDLDWLWRNMCKTSCRQPINRAKRAGVIIKMGQNYDDFYEIYCSLREKKGLPWLERLEVIRKYSTLFTAEVDGEVLGGFGYLEDEDNIRAWVAGSKRLGADRERAALISNASRLAIWESMIYAKEKGIKEFDLGGYYTGEDKSDPRYKINIFKQSFGGQITRRYIYEKTYSRAYQLLRSMRRKLILRRS